MRLKKKVPAVDQSAARFRENLDAVSDRPRPHGEEFSRFRRLTEGLLRVSKGEIDKRRR